MRCALYFGSFNPLHTGHIAIAKYVMEHCDIDCIRLVLSPQSPFKTTGILEDPQQRLQTLQQGVDRFNARYTPEEGQKCKTLEICTAEFNLPKPNYTYDTLKYLQSREPENTFIIVVGADNLASIEKWYRWQEILRNFSIMVYPRKGFRTKTLCKKYGATCLAAPLKNISSSLIREREKEGKNTSKLKY